ncbi:hypothetical protein D9757_003486 [Collybiopsis confluens]|uniref:Uncharacterized protein n=1 Tax=Collybiopsis confluens TaxID=2823264 RepID=A0A8H5MCU1_9AGAR|nr:hypothetical protein D9757_003486 [Collybiopsis confluens]
MAPSMKEGWTPDQTIVRIDQPERYTGLERIMLVAQGDLQRLLSAFFADVINVEVLYAHNTSRHLAASPETPVIQTRKVLLKCRSVVVCTATSTVTFTSPECERLMLDEKFAIGQTFRYMKEIPAFRLKSVLIAGTPSGEEELSRTYTLACPGIHCEILEVFPSRSMFTDGEEWFAQHHKRNEMDVDRNLDTDNSSDSGAE